MKLLIYKYDELIQEAQLERGTFYVVGRQADCDIILEKFPGISRKHFEIGEDAPGLWKVRVLSKVKLVEFQGQEEEEFNLEGKGEFLLQPHYRFAYEIEEFEKEGLENSSGGDSLDHFSNSFNVSQQIADSDSEREGAGMGQKTVIRNFEGVPYIKIIGQYGKKSEYFRLEGNLWVVGNDEDASVYFKEPNASKNHFEISKTKKGFFVIDSGSSLGTELNGQKLSAKKPHPLFSGDIINVGRVSIQFELRDKSFKKKVHEIPMKLYKNPLVFFDQEVAMVAVDEKVERPGEVKQVSMVKATGKKKTRKFMMTLMAGLVVAVALWMEFSGQMLKEKKLEVPLGPLGKLSSVEQKVVKQTYKLAKQLYLSGNFELSLVQLEKLHSIIPDYKDSREMEEYCINSRELKYQQAMIEKQKRDQEEMVNKVNSLVAQCNKNFKGSDDVDGVRACLEPASALDPGHPGISQLISEVTARIEEKRLREKIAQEEAEKIRRSNELYEKARLLHKKNSYLEAIEAYENHIHSGLPDPKRLVKRSKRYLSSIETMIKTQKTDLMDQARSMYKNKKLKEAITFSRQAQKVDPHDSEISIFVFNLEKELNTNMKNVYVDSVIEERFGNLEASRMKWETILKLDVEDGEYYRKAERKLKQYGYKH